MVVLSVQTLQLADLGRIPTSEAFELSLQRRLSCSQVEWHWQTTELCQFALLQHKGNGGTWVSGATSIEHSLGATQRFPAGKQSVR